MKKILFLIFTFLICTGSALATNHIYDIDMEIYVDKNGTAYITETWSVDGSDGSEWYKVYNNLGSSELTNFKVYMDGKLLTYKNWDVSESLNQKKDIMVLIILLKVQNYVLVSMIITITNLN